MPRHAAFLLGKRTAWFATEESSGCYHKAVHCIPPPLFNKNLVASNLCTAHESANSVAVQASKWQVHFKQRKQRKEDELQGTVTGRRDCPSPHPFLLAEHFCVSPDNSPTIAYLSELAAYAGGSSGSSGIRMACAASAGESEVLTERSSASRAKQADKQLESDDTDSTALCCRSVCGTVLTHLRQRQFLHSCSLKPA